jgi:D-erythrulose 1-phosphate 3-epimerase
MTTTFRLGINTCFAVKRWPEPGAWSAIVAELGLDLVQHSLDLVDLDTAEDDLDRQASEVARACREADLTLHSTFTGLAAYSGNLLLHPDRARRDRAAGWYRRAIDFTAAAGGRSTGGHVGDYSVADYANRDRRAQLWRWLQEELADLAGYAHVAGLDSLMIENLAAAREPSSMSAVRSLLTPGDDTRVPIVACLDVGHQCVAGATGAELDPYAWLSALGARSPIVQLQQSDAVADHHWPFTPETNAAGRIEAPRVLRALRESGTAEVALILEIIPAFEAPDDQVIADLRVSVEYWRRHLADANGS